jgi:hypothetical protein
MYDSLKTCATVKIRSRRTNIEGSFKILSRWLPNSSKAAFFYHLVHKSIVVIVQSLRYLLTKRTSS